MKSAAIFGAGNIGRGFIGQLFSESGYEVVFVDIDTKTLELFNTAGGYDLETVFDDEVERFRIAPVRGVDARDEEAVCELLCQVDLVATAVGVRALEYVAPHFARAAAARSERRLGRLNTILCENLKDASTIFRRMVQDLTPANALGYLDLQMGFVDPVIGRMVPPLTEAQRALNPTLIRVEPYKELPVDRRGFRGAVPTVVGMAAHDNFPVYTARKLYIHNCGHAVLAYAGHHAGYEFGWEAMADTDVSTLLHEAWEESAAGIVHAYGADMDWLREHMTDLDHRFRNKALGDTVFRLGRDPIRKLGPTDRLVAPALLAHDAGVAPKALARAIALALAFDHPEDPVAVDLQAGIARHGAAAALADATALPADHPLTELIIDAYGDITSG